MMEKVVQPKLPWSNVIDGSVIAWLIVLVACAAHYVVFIG